MTFGQAHKTMRRMLKGTVSLQPGEIDELINEAIQEAVASWADRVESDSSARQALTGLRPPPVTGNGTRPSSSQLAGFYRLLSLEADFGDADWVAVTPSTSDTLARARQSWIHKPTVSVPVYQLYTQMRSAPGRDPVRVWEIEAEQDADRWRINYLTKPQVVNGRDLPGEDWTDFPYSVQVRILQAARRKAAGESGDANEYQAAGADELKSTSPGLRGL